MCKHKVTSILLLFQMLIMSGCNPPLRDNSPPETDSPEIVFTSAAETTDAQLSPTMIPATKEPLSTDTPAAREVTPSPEPTASSTPTEAPTATQIPEVIFFDDFSDTTGWYTYEDDRFGFKYTSDGYHIYNNIKMGLIWSIREQEFSGVVLEVDGTRLEGPEDSYFGVVCKFADDGDNYYALVIGDNGFYGVGLMENGEYEFIKTGTDEADIINHGQGETNRLRGVCNGNHFTVYANGELLLDVWDSTLAEGIVGLVVGNQRSGSGTEFRFNDFAISWP